MQRHMEIEGSDIGKMRAVILRRLQQLEGEQIRLADTIREMERRLTMLDEVQSWDLSGDDQREVNVTLESQPRNGDARLAIMALADAIVYLRRENPAITKQEVRERLESIGYRFATAREHIGRAVHAGWISADRRMADIAG